MYMVYMGCTFFPSNDTMVFTTDRQHWSHTAVVGRIPELPVYPNSLIQHTTTNTPHWSLVRLRSCLVLSSDLIRRVYWFQYNTCNTESNPRWGWFWVLDWDEVRPSAVEVWQGLKECRSPTKVRNGHPGSSHSDEACPIVLMEVSPNGIPHHIRFE